MFRFTFRNKDIILAKNIGNCYSCLFINTSSLNVYFLILLVIMFLLMVFAIEGNENNFMGVTMIHGSSAEDVTKN